MTDTEYSSGGEGTGGCRTSHGCCVRVQGASEEVFQASTIPAAHTCSDPPPPASFSGTAFRAGVASRCLHVGASSRRLQTICNFDFGAFVLSIFRLRRPDRTARLNCPSIFNSMRLAEVSALRCSILGGGSH